MSYQLSFGLLLALFWGIAVALGIRFWPVGRFLARHLMWFVVALGCGVDTLIMLLLVEDGRLLWSHMISVFFVSSIPIAFASIWDLSRYFQGIIDGFKRED